MGDLIDRQVAIDRINKQREHLRPDIYSQDKICDAAYRICAEFIERLPSAQPEIIRCKDCKYFYENRWCIRYLKAFLPDDYCSYAERRNDD